MSVISRLDLHEKLKGSKAITQDSSHEIEITHVIKITQMTTDGRIRLGEYWPTLRDGIRNVHLLSDPTEVTKIELRFGGNVIDTICPSITGDTEFPFFREGALLLSSVFQNTELHIDSKTMVVFSYEFLQVNVGDEALLRECVQYPCIHSKLVCEKHITPFSAGTSSIDFMALNGIITRLRLIASGPIESFNLKTIHGDIEVPLLHSNDSADATFDPPLDLSKTPVSFEITTKEARSVWIMYEFHDIMRWKHGLMGFAYS